MLGGLRDGGSGGFFLSLLTESFAVRALLGSLAAAALAAWVIRAGLVCSTRARRLLVLAPVLVSVTAAVASMAWLDEAYLPQLWVASATSGAAGPLLELLGDVRVLSADRGADVLLLAYSLVVSVLLARRVLGMVRVRRLLSAAIPADGTLIAAVDRLARNMALRSPRVLLLDGCPGGAFTVGYRRPVVTVDPALLDQLDARELEGLLAHELAHIRRRDALVCAVVGVCRDLTFFLPTIHVAVRWLQREQEESADEVASAVTARPAALASSILKVWDRNHSRPALRMGCAAVPLAARRLAFAGIGQPPQPRVSPAARAVAARVERLIDGPPAASALRRTIEVVLAGAIIGMATSASLVVPRWIATDLNTYSLSFMYLSAPSAPAVESPAFATFRRLAPEAVPPTDSVEARAAAHQPVRAFAQPGELMAPSAGQAEQVTPCPCVESQAQLNLGVGATAPQAVDRMLWRSQGHHPWQLNEAARRARPLLTIGDTGPQVGFFLISPATVAAPAAQ